MVRRRRAESDRRGVVVEVTSEGDFAMRTVMAIHAALLLLLVGGCAKRPSSVQGSATSPGSPGGVAATRTQPAAPDVGGTSSPIAGPAEVASGAARPAPKDFTTVSALRSIAFDLDKYEIRPADVEILDANAAWLKDNSKLLVLIEGHCDARGTNEYNLALGERRAQAAKSYLLSQGIRSDRITIISYGEERLACADQSEDCWARNRRAQFLVKPE
jgi:peptidoglycan-associated lipoprotein